MGCEEQIAFKALSRATHPDYPDITVTAVVAYSGIPGRVFADAASAVDARKFAASIPELNPHVLRLVPEEDIPSILYIKKPFTFDGKDWARILGRGKGWTVYKGDIGMFIQNEGNRNLALIPRIQTIQSKFRQRPAQSLFTLPAIKAIFGENSVNSISQDGSFTFKGRRYTKEGFLYCDTDEVELCRPADDIPTQKEFQMFRESGLMTEDTLTRTLSRLEQLKISIGSRVFVVQGEFRGLIGRIIDIAENEVTIFIDSLNYVQQLLKSEVRTTYRIGDEIQICNGKYCGSVGWIVDAQDHTVTVVNVEKDMEVIALRCQSHLNIG